MILLEAFILGFFINMVTGTDDVLTCVPFLVSFTKTRLGKIGFALGMVAAVSVAVAVAYLFSDLLNSLPAYRTVVAVLIVFLAVAIEFDVLTNKPKKKAQFTIEQKAKRISLERFTQLFGIGFLASLTTVLDDVIAYLPVFLGEPRAIAFGIAGIVTATVLQAVIAIFFAGQIARLPYKKEISAGGLLIVALLILTGVL